MGPWIQWGYTIFVLILVLFLFWKYIFIFVIFFFQSALDGSTSIFRVLRSRGQADRVPRGVRRRQVAAESKVFTLERSRRFAGKETGINWIVFGIFLLIIVYFYYFLYFMIWTCKSTYYWFERSYLKCTIGKVWEKETFKWKFWLIQKHQGFYRTRQHPYKKCTKDNNWNGWWYTNCSFICSVVLFRFDESLRPKLTWIGNFLKLQIILH